MAATQIIFGKWGFDCQGNPDLLDRESFASETIAPTGSSQQTAIEAPAVGQRPVCRIATDTAVYVAIGASPDATNAAARIMVPADRVAHILCNAGDKAAVVTV